MAIIIIIIIIIVIIITRRPFYWKWTKHRVRAEVSTRHKWVKQTLIAYVNIEDHDRHVQPCPYFYLRFAQYKFYTAYIVCIRNMNIPNRPTYICLMAINCMVPFCSWRVRCAVTREKCYFVICEQQKPGSARTYVHFFLLFVTLVDVCQLIV